MKIDTTRGFLLATASAVAISLSAAVQADTATRGWVELEGASPNARTDRFSETVDDNATRLSFSAGMALPNRDLTIGLRYSQERADADSDYYGYDANNTVGSDTLDFEVGKDMSLGENTSGRLTLGLRYAQIDTDFSYDFGYTVSNSSEFDGFGPRVAAEVEFGVAKNVSVDAAAGLAVLFGEAEHTYTYDGTSYDNGSTDGPIGDFEFSAALSYLIMPNAKVSLRYRMRRIGDADFRFGPLSAEDKLQTDGAFLKLRMDF